MAHDLIKKLFFAINIQIRQVDQEKQTPPAAFASSPGIHIKPYLHWIYTSI
jgi:hypothetical protein